MGLCLVSLMVFFSCLYGVDYLPSAVLLNEDSRSYVRGFFLTININIMQQYITNLYFYIPVDVLVVNFFDLRPR
jgi:hypothetical protein